MDLFEEASKAVAEADASGGGAEDEDEEDVGEPEDDFNAAWEVLDLARAIYEKQKDEDEEIMLKLADTYIALGDISLETGAQSYTKQIFLGMTGSLSIIQKNSSKESRIIPRVSPSNPPSCPSPLVKSPKHTTNSPWSSTSPLDVYRTLSIMPNKLSNPSRPG